MTDTKQRFSKIAKLLAEENITVTFDNIRTAHFDLENRNLALPLFKEHVSDDVYGMMVAHEVGHALYTPLDEWVDFIKETGGNTSVRKSYANVLEDVRIERLIKSRFPGIVRDMNLGYKEIHNKNFFDLEEGEDLSKRELMDRINLHFKSYGNIVVPFKDDERVWLDRAIATETFEDVLQLTRDLLEHEKNKKKEEQQQQQDQDQGQQQQQIVDNTEDGQEEEKSGEYLYDDSEDDGNSEDSQKEQSSQKEDSDSNEEYDDEEVSNNKASEDIDDEEDTETNEVDNGDDDVTEDDLAEVKSGESLSENLENSTDDNTYGYNKIVQFDDRKMATMWRDVVVSTEDFINNRYHLHNFNNYDHTAIRKIADEQTKNTVQKYVQEFERKHAARVSKRTRTSNTGRIDSNKLVNYRWDDNLFLSNEISDKGKNHGIVMIIDLSGSMGNKIKDTFIQVYTMVKFAERVNIPYTVFGFTDSVLSVNANDIRRNGDCYITVTGKEHGDCFSNSFNTLSLVNIINNTVSKDIKEKFYNLVAASCFSNQYAYSGFHGTMWHGILSMTPLLSTLMLTPSIIKDFKNTNNVEKTTLILYTDGSASDTAFIVTKQESGKLVQERMNYRYNRFFDVQTKSFYDYKNNHGMQFECLQVFLTDRIRNIDGVRVIGFFINDSRNTKDMKETVLRFAHHNNAKVVSKLDGVYRLDNVFGYDMFTMVHNSTLSTKTLTLEETFKDSSRSSKDITEVSNKVLEKTFVKSNNVKNASKVIVRDIIDIVA